LDCFSGSATAATAAVLHGRQFIGIDNDAEMVLWSRDRINAAIEESKQRAATVELPSPLEGEQKEADALRRLKTVSKHTAAATKEAIGHSRRNRPINKAKFKAA
jgi:predicted RecB family endonuclease